MGIFTAYNQSNLMKQISRLNDKISEKDVLISKCKDQLKEELAQCGHDPSVGIDASELINLIQDIEDHENGKKRRDISY